MVVVVAFVVVRGGEVGAGQFAVGVTLVLVMVGYALPLAREDVSRVIAATFLFTYTPKTGKMSVGSSLPRFCSHTHQRQGRCQWGRHCHVSVQIHIKDREDVSGVVTATFLFRYTSKTSHWKNKVNLKKKQDWQLTRTKHNTGPN